MELIIKTSAAMLCVCVEVRKVFQARTAAVFVQCVCVEECVNFQHDAPIRVAYR